MLVTCHLSLSPVTITCCRTCCHLCQTHHYSLPNRCCLLRGAETLHLLPLLSLPEFVIAAMSDKSMMKLNNENYEIWKILMEAILIRKQLRDIALGWMLRLAGPPNVVWAWDWKNQEARAKLQLAIK